MSFLSACAGVPSDACPPAPEYSQGTREEAARQIERLPEGSALIRILEDCAVLRDQVRACD